MESNMHVQDARNPDRSNGAVERLPERDASTVECMAETAVLGALLTRADALERIEPALHAEDFGTRRHCYLYAALCEVDDDGRGADLLAVAASLERDGRLGTCGGLEGLQRIADGAAEPGELERCAAIVRDKAVERRLLAASDAIAKSVRGPGDARHKLDRAQSLVASIAERGSHTGPQSAAVLMAQVTARLERQAKGEIGLSTPWPDLDRLTNGLHPGDLVIIAGRPGMGKTSIAMQIATDIAVNKSLPVFVASLEMSSEDLLMRSAAVLEALNVQKLISGKLSADEHEKYAKASERLSGAPLYIDDSAGMSVLEIRSHARKLKRERGLSLLVVDYLQLMEAEGENRTQQLSWISRRMKLLAKELHIPVILLSQLNRGLEYRDDKRPVMADLRECGAIEQDADLIQFVYRDVVYHPHTKSPEMAELIIGKQRNGPPGTVYLHFEAESCRFSPSDGLSSFGAPKPVSRRRIGFEC